MDQDILELSDMQDEHGGSPWNIKLWGAQFLPLGYEELRTLGHPPMIEVRWRNGRVIATDNPRLRVGNVVDGQYLIQGLLASRAVGLVQGGWLPAILAAMRDTLVLPDRCVIADLRTRFVQGVRQPGREADSIDLFADRRMRINPLFFALEGNVRRLPTDDEAKQQLDEGVALLRAALPKANVVTNDASFTAMLGVLRDSTPRLLREQQFLMRLAPRLAAPVSRRKIGQRWTEALRAAQDCGVHRTSLALLAVLSTILMPNGTSPAKRLLKFKPQYSAADAYNALADLRSLDIIMHLFARFPRERVTLCTTDRDLALFWSGLRASNFVGLDGGMKFDLSPAALLPGITNEQFDALHRLE